MRQKWTDQFLHESQIAGHISGRGVIKRVGSGAMMLGVCGLADLWLPAMLVFATLCVLEYIAYPLNQRASQFENALTFGTAVLVFLINLAGILPFLAFGLVLSFSTSLPFVLIGFMWAFAVFVHVTNTFGLLPLYNWSQMIPAFGTVFVMIWLLSTNAAFPAEAVHWVLTACLMLVYISNTSDTMSLQKDTHTALSRAREEANARLIALERLSRHDPLTGLMNRRAFDETVESLMRQHTNKLGVTVFLLDLDGFKPINDSYSHIAGDAVLCEIAERLQGLASDRGHVARLGGDEFAIVRTDITSANRALKLGERVIASLRQPIAFEQKKLQVGVSLGIARQGPDAATLNALISGADQAMYRAKQDPDKAQVIFDKTAFPVRASLEDRNTLIAAMRASQIKPYYQPKVALNTSAIVGFEALSRWEHPERGVRPPSEFLPQINELGLQGEFMIHTAKRVLEDIQAWSTDGLDPGQVSINVSEATLATLSGHHDLLAIIDRYPHLRQHLTFEITEDIFIARSSDMIQRSIANFRHSGVRISLDDFGTGFASFQHLKDLEFDELKLDTGFIRDLGVDPAAHVLVQGLLSMGHGLGVQVVAEGVETAEQRETLRKMGCHVVQGYLYGGAIPASEVMIRLNAEGHHFTARHPQRHDVA